MNILSPTQIDILTRLSHPQAYIAALPLYNFEVVELIEEGFPESLPIRHESFGALNKRGWIVRDDTHTDRWLMSNAGRKALKAVKK